MRQIPVKEYEEDIERLDVRLRELKLKYDQFFAGSLKRQPFEVRKDVERIIDRMSRHSPGKFSLRFRFNSLVHKYNSFCERWSKTLRTMEEGNRRTASVAERLGLREHLITRCVVRGDAEQAQSELERLHARFVAARERQGKRAVSLEKFVQGITAQTRRLRETHECDQIEVRLVESGDEVQIRARPGR